jgi:orotidine-5'-phosphate decarboxylase
MNRSELIHQIRTKQNFLCIGLDPDLEKIPTHLLDYEDPIFEFCRQIIESTSDIAVAYKPNLAFFECMGTKGWQSLEKIMKLIPKHCFTIADAKRGDIGNTSKMYAKCFFEYFDFDAITVAPYMGRDSIEPFLSYDGKWVIVLGLTSNTGSMDFEMLDTSHGKLYEQVISKASQWGNQDNMMFVVGATQPDFFTSIRGIVPDHFLLVPGVGAQGGSLEDVCNTCVNADFGVLVNNGRNVLYASADTDFASAARIAALDNIKAMRELVQF